VAGCSGAQYGNTVPTWNALARIAMLCNRAEFKTGQDQTPVLKRLSLPVIPAYSILIS